MSNRILDEMLLRIDVYPYTDNANIEETDEDGIPVSPLNPLYACLGTSRADGELVTVGRKETDVALKDKSVSRKHLTVSLVTTHDSIENLEFAKPTTPQEEQACENDGFCLVVTDSSSFGTFLVKEGNAPRNTTPADKDATDNSDTEDESQNPSNAVDAGVKLSPIATKLTNSKAILEKIEGRLVLPEFKKRVLIQCGRNGSTLLIRRIPLTLAWSGLDKSTKDLWTKRLPALGASILQNAHDSMTHLVSNERVSTGKHLAAWYMNKPAVTTEYLQALWDRKSPTAVMPKEIDCQLTIGGNEAFWKKKPKTNLLSGCTYLCLLHDDMKALVQAAGATIVPLYEMSEKDAINHIKDMDMTHAFYIATAVAKMKKVVSYLKRHDVAHVTQKALGQAVAKFLRLEDQHGNTIGPEEVLEEQAAPSQEEEREQPSLSEESKETSGKSLEQMGVDESVGESSKKRTHENSQEPIEEEASTKTAGSRKKRSKEGPREEPSEEEPPKQRRKTPRKPAEEDISAETSSTRKKRSKDSSKEPEELEPPKQCRKMSMEAAEEKDSSETGSRKKRSKESLQEEKPAEEEPPKQRHKTSKELEPIVEEKSREEEKEDEPGWNPGDEPKKLQVSSDGWFVAAPSGKKRKAYVREIAVGDHESPPPTAATAESSKLVVGARKTTFAMNARATSMGRCGGKNFKKFHKNTVTKGSVSRIQLRSVLPEESEAERQLDERERALEEEQRVADALFRDPGAGIRGHFKPKAKHKRS